MAQSKADSEVASVAPPTRRSFLFMLGLALDAVAAVLVGIPVLGYLLGPTRRQTAQAWIQLGPLESFREGETRLATYENPFHVPWDGPTAKIACWVRRLEGEQFQVLAINCTHLGCPVRWFVPSRLFMCPCHGGAYYEDGSRASGPPLLWLGAPLLPMLSGLPQHLLHRWVGPLVACPPLTLIGQWLVHPTVAWVLFVGSTWVWHTPALYEQALASEGWHDAQHTCFLVTALAFWWPVVQPWPSRPVVSPWGIVLYLILADVQNTVLSAWLVFAERLIYPSYAAVSRPWGISALNDQAAAGAIMWVSGSVAFLVPVAWMVGQLLSPKGSQIIILRRQPLVDGRMRLGSTH